MVLAVLGDRGREYRCHSSFGRWAISPCSVSPQDGCPELCNTLLYLDMKEELCRILSANELGFAFSSARKECGHLELPEMKLCYDG